MTAAARAGMGAGFWSSPRLLWVAAALVVVGGDVAAASGVTAWVRVVGAAIFSREPEWFTLAPIGALRKPVSNHGI